MKLEFKPEDFNGWKDYPPEANITGIMAFIANAKLRKWLEKAPVIKGEAFEIGDGRILFTQLDIEHPRCRNRGNPEMTLFFFTLNVSFCALNIYFGLFGASLWLNRASWFSAGASAVSALYIWGARR